MKCCPPSGAKPAATPAALRIIAEAMRQDTKLPLYYVAGAGLTEVAQAVRLEPRTAARIKLIWIGGPEYDYLRLTRPVNPIKEYNTTIDLAAAKIIFNESELEIWQIPRDTYRIMLISFAISQSWLAGSWRLGIIPGKSAGKSYHDGWRTWRNLRLGRQPSCDAHVTTVIFRARCLIKRVFRPSDATNQRSSKL